MIYDEVRGNRGELIALHKVSAAQEARLDTLEKNRCDGIALKHGLIVTAISSVTAFAIFHLGRIVPALPTP